MDRRFLSAVGIVLAIAGSIALAIWKWPREELTDPTPAFEGARAFAFIDFIKDQGGCRLIRVEYKDGELIPGEVIWEGERRPFLGTGRHRVFDVRYVISNSGLILDLTTKAVLLQDQNAENVQVEGRAVSFEVRNRRLEETGIFTYNLSTHERKKIAKLTDGKYGLPGLLSPDGTKSLDNSNGTETALHELGKTSRVLAREFNTQLSPSASDSGLAPVLWIDNQRILAHSRNGELVELSLEGKRTPVVTIPDTVDKELFANARLTRDRLGRIIYSCGGSYVIDPDARRWEHCKWADLGNGFDISWTPEANGSIVRYRGERIGQFHCLAGSNDVETIEGTIAAIVQYRDTPNESYHELKSEIRVWSTRTRKWASMKPYWPQSIVGWVR